MVEKATSLEHIEVASELEALLLESRLIKKFKPFYNLISKDDKSPYYVHISKEEYPRPVVNHEAKGAIAGPFLNRYLPTWILRRFRQVAPFCLAPRPVRRPCLYAHLGLCSPCPGQIVSPDQKELYQEHISLLKRLLRGQFSSVKKNLTTQMAAASKAQDYESAGQLKNYLLALDQLSVSPTTPEEYIVNPNLTQDLRQAAVESLSDLLKIAPPNRVEMYDNAHLGGVAPTSAMTVAVAGELLPRFYRHFTIKTAPSNSDVDMMAEVISRRFKNTDWPTPDLVVLDGGKPQLSKIKGLIPAHIPVIGLAKRLETIVIPVGDDYQEINPPKTHPGLKLLMQLRDEAHRFSRRLHHKHRKLIFP